MSHLATPWHCWLDRLGRTTLILIAALGVIYLSNYLFGWPNEAESSYRARHAQSCAREPAHP